MMRKLIACIFVLTLATPLIPLAAQTTSGQTESLGALARKLKAQRKEEGKKPAAVFTNDSIPKTGSMDTVEVSSGTNSKSEQPASGKSKAASEDHGEAYFSKKAKSIRDDMSMHERELKVLQQQASQAQINYYPNPQTTLEQESGPKFQSKVNDLQKKIDEKKQQIAKDQKALDDIQQELRRDGGNPGWIR